MKKKWSLLGLLLVMLMALTSGTWADFDADGLVDVFVVEPNSVDDATGVARWYEADGAGGYVRSGGAFCYTGGIAEVGNYDGDDNMDLLITSTYPGWGVSWYEATGVDGGMRLVTNKFGGDTTDLDFFDFDDNGVGDLFIIRANNLHWYEITADDTHHWVGFAAYNCSCVAVGDLDHFYGNDFLVGKNTAISWYEWDSINNKLSWIQNFNDVDCRGITFGDFDGDDHTDIFWLSGDNRSLKWWELHSDHAGAIWVQVNDANSIIENNRNYTDIRLGDFDGDGRNELMASHPSSNLRYFKAVGDSVLAELTSPIAGTNALGVTIAGVARPCDDAGLLWADINGDCQVGDADLASMADAWLESRSGPGPMLGDLTGNLTVNLNDFFLLSNSWLACTGTDAGCVELPHK